MIKRIDFEEVKAFIRDVVVNCAFLIVVYFLVTSFLFTPFRVSGDSMEETLLDRERIIVSKIGYYSHGPERGDIVVFHPPSDPKVFYIKRVIGIPGDRVELKGGRVYVNGIEVEEPYLRPGVATCAVGRLSSCLTDQKKYIVPEGHYFVLGDNRDSSSDSRGWKNKNGEDDPFVSLDRIQGKTKLVIWPLTGIRWVEDPL